MKYKKILKIYMNRNRITGLVSTKRESNLRNFERLAHGNKNLYLGINLHKAWKFNEILDLMHKKVGIIDNINYKKGQDIIQSNLCINALDRFSNRLKLAIRDKEKVLFATGHPAGLLTFYILLIEFLVNQGISIIKLRSPVNYDDGDIRSLRGVHTYHKYGSLMHTHSPKPMKILLNSLNDKPDLVIADHGWAGHASSRGISTIGLADSNDPALFIAEEQKDIEVVVPLDDNISPDLYYPLFEYIKKQTS